MKAIVLTLIVALSGCGASQRETTLKAALVTLDTARDATLAYDGPHELTLVATGTPIEAKAALAAYRLKRARVELAMTLAYRALAIAVAANDGPTLDAVQVAIAQVTLGYTALLAGGSK